MSLIERTHSEFVSYDAVYIRLLFRKEITYNLTELKSGGRIEETLVSNVTKFFVDTGTLVLFHNFVDKKISFTDSNNSKLVLTEDSPSFAVSTSMFEEVHLRRDYTEQPKLYASMMSTDLSKSKI